MKNVNILILSYLLLLSTLGKTQSNCINPIPITVCNSITLIGETTAGMGNDNDDNILSSDCSGNDKLYEISSGGDLETILVHITSSSNLKLIWLGDNCSGTTCSNLYTTPATGCNFEFDVTTPGPQYLWVDHDDDQNDVTYDITFGARMEPVVVNIPDTRGDWGFDLTNTCAPTTAYQPHFEVTYNGDPQYDPFMFEPLEVEGTLCTTVYLENLTGDEGLIKIEWMFGSDLQVLNPDTTSKPGFYNTGNWNTTDDMFTWEFTATAGTGRGDFDGTPNACLAYEFCYDLIPYSNDFGFSKVEGVYYPDGEGTPFMGMTQVTCCANQSDDCCIEPLGYPRTPSGPISLSYDPEPSPPNVSDNSSQTDEDTPVTIDVLSNIPDPNGVLDPTSVTIVTPPANGTATVNPDGTIDYTPAPDFNGEDTFVYQVCNQTGQCSSGGVTSTVNPVDDPPVLIDDAEITDEDTPVTIGVLYNDSDPDNDLDFISTTITLGPANGTVIVEYNGTVTYTPDPDFFGTDSFEYQACDYSNLCSTAAVTVFVDPVNDPPVLADDFVYIPDYAPVVIPVLANDSDFDDSLDPTSITITTAPANGTVVVESDGTVTYYPEFNYFGTITFEYEACDTGSPVQCDRAVTILDIYPLIPIELISFEATSNEETILLEWIVASEINNSHFEIERAKRDGSWNKLGEVTGRGNATSTKTYTFNDERPLHGINYYRLKQVDFDGTATYTEIASAKRDYNLKDFGLFPNPATKNTTVELPVFSMEKITISLYDSQGRMLKEVQTTAGQSGLEVVELDLEGISTGLYFIHVGTDTFRSTKRLLIAK